MYGNLYKEFKEQILPGITKKVILVSHGHANPLDSEMAEILAHENVVHWFAMNVKTAHPKVTPIPFGVSEHLEIHLGHLSSDPE